MLVNKSGFLEYISIPEYFSIELVESKVLKMFFTNVEIIDNKINMNKLREFFSENREDGVKLINELKFRGFVFKFSKNASFIKNIEKEDSEVIEIISINDNKDRYKKLNQRIFSDFDFKDISSDYYFNLMPLYTFKNKQILVKDEFIKAGFKLVNSSKLDSDNNFEGEVLKKQKIETKVKEKDYAEKEVNDINKSKDKVIAKNNKIIMNNEESLSKIVKNDIVEVRNFNFNEVLIVNIEVFNKQIFNEVMNFLNREKIVYLSQLVDYDFSKLLKNTSTQLKTNIFLNVFKDILQEELSSYGLIGINDKNIRAANKSKNIIDDVAKDKKEKVKTSTTLTKELEIEEIEKALVKPKKQEISTTATLRNEEKKLEIQNEPSKNEKEIKADFNIKIKEASENSVKPTVKSSLLKDIVSNQNDTFKDIVEYLSINNINDIKDLNEFNFNNLISLKGISIKDVYEFSDFINTKLLQ